MYQIINQRRSNSVVGSIEVEAPHVARRCEPGQFVIVRVEPGRKK